MSQKSVVRELGVPVQAVNRAHLYAGRDGEGAPCLYTTMSQQAGNFFVLQIDPKAGATRQFSVDVPESKGAATGSGSADRAGRSALQIR